MNLRKNLFKKKVGSYLVCFYFSWLKSGATAVIPEQLAAMA